MSNGPSSNYTIFHKRFTKRHSYGIYAWKRWSKGPKCIGWGYVLRLGPLGHFQLQWRRFAYHAQGAKHRYEYSIHKWGIAGRRGKKGIFWGRIK